MASLVKKIKKGKAYWHAVECQRVDGKPRIVWQKYLGRVDEIVKAVEGGTAPPPESVLIRQFGGVAALLGVAEQLDLVAIVDRHVRKRRQGASIGQYMLLAAVNRACDPKSKLQIGEWYEQTILNRLWKHPASTFTSQRFWDAMDAVSEAAMAVIERDLVERLMQTTRLDLRAILYDTTNFATFIHTLNERNTIAQRGHAKSKRHDLRLVGLALVVTRTFGIPLMHQTYAGNVNDSTQFGSLTLQLAERYRQLAQGCEELTLVFDKGKGSPIRDTRAPASESRTTAICLRLGSPNNSDDNFTLLGMEQVHFVASLVPSQHPDLLEIPLEKYQPLQGDEWAGVRAYRCQREVFGQMRTVVVTFSESFFSQQAQAIMASLAKCVRKLEELAKRLRLWHSPREGQRKPSGHPPGRSAVERQVKEILSAQHMRQVLRAEVGDTKAGLPTLSFSSDQDELQRLIERLCGKTILFTDRDAWSNEGIVSAYRAQSGIEERFRDMNDWDFLRWTPMYHWTDQKIRVHAFYCVLALMLVGVLRQRLSQAGIDLPTHALLDTLSKMLETVVVYPPTQPPAPPRLATTLSRFDAQQKAIYTALELSRWRSAEG